MHIILYIATSLDGYIARTDGGIDWLESVHVADEDYGYADFYESVDVVVMGRKTFDQVQQFGEWPYAGKQTIVFSRQAHTTTRPDVQYFNGSPESLAAQLEDSARVWLVGGGLLNNTFLKSRAIDEIILSIIPVCLGDGIPLFRGDSLPLDFKMMNCTTYDTGVVQIYYKRYGN